MSAVHEPSRSELAAEARALLRKALKGTLASLDAERGYPYASLLTLASDVKGAPTFLISNLARHTRNLVHDPRSSILVDMTGGLGNPLEGARLTVHGRAEPIEDERAKDGAMRRFLARHPDAAGYSTFSDFALWHLVPEGGHYIGGFGRILDFTPDELLVKTDGAEALIEAEPGIVSHMNEDHTDAIALYATKLLGAEDGPWRMTGCDPEGCDLLLEDKALRLAFHAPLKTPDEVRKALVAFVQEARAQAA